MKIKEKYKELLNQITSVSTKEEFDNVLKEIDFFVQRHQDNDEFKELFKTLLNLTNLIKLKLRKKQKFKFDEELEPKEYLITQEQFEKLIEEKWSTKYKRSIDCNNPKGFSQKAHCQGRKKGKSE